MLPASGTASGAFPPLPPLLAGALAFLALAAGLLLALPHLQDPVWQDEAYMLMNFSDKGFLYPFTDYHLPNNHILVSSLFALWSDPGDPVAQTRLLPLLLFALSMGVLLLAVRRIAGMPAAILALALFAASHVTRDFAAQIRGYSASWLALAALLLATPRWAVQGGWASGALVAVAAAASVAILPTNMWFCVGFALWGSALCLLEGGLSREQRAFRVAVLLAGPLAGLLAYAAVGEQLLLAATRPWSGWTYGAIGAHWARAALADHLWLLPLTAVGLLVLGHRALGAARHPPSRQQLLYLACVAVVPLLMAAVTPYPPFPRTFVPMLPLAYAGLAMLAAAAWSLPPLARHRGVALGSFAVAAMVVLLSSARSEPCGGDAPASEFPQDLCHSFYHRQYRPDLVMGVLRELAKTQVVSVVTDDEGFWALSFQVRQGTDFPLELVRHQLWLDEERARGTPRHPGLVVTRSRDALAQMMSAAGLPPGRYGEFDTGYFKVYASEAER